MVIEVKSHVPSCRPCERSLKNGRRAKSTTVWQADSSPFKAGQVGNIRNHRAVAQRNPRESCRTTMVGLLLFSTTRWMPRPATPSILSV
jgi:hypothetical protein